MEIIGYPHSFIGNRTEHVRCPREVPMISDGALSVFLRSPCDALSANYYNKPFGDRTIIAGSLYGARTTCQRATVLRFLKICQSADYYKFVEANIVPDHPVDTRRKCQNWQCAIIASLS